MATQRRQVAFSLTNGQREALESLVLHGRVSRFSHISRNPYLSLELKGLVLRGAGYDNWSLTQLGTLLMAALPAR